MKIGEGAGGEGGAAGGLCCEKGDPGHDGGRGETGPEEVHAKDLGGNEPATLVTSALKKGSLVVALLCPQGKKAVADFQGRA